jgi:hypothetical protein
MYCLCVFRLFGHYTWKYTLYAIHYTLHTLLYTIRYASLYTIRYTMYATLYTIRFSVFVVKDPICRSRLSTLLKTFCFCGDGWKTDMCITQQLPTQNLSESENKATFHLHFFSKLCIHRCQRHGKFSATRQSKIKLRTMIVNKQLLPCGRVHKA